MTERIFNLFYFEHNRIIRELGAVVHEFKGSDAEKTVFLQKLVTNDFVNSKKFPLPTKYTNITADAYFSLFRLGKHLELFEEILFELNAPLNPFCCVTAIVDGQPKIDITTDHSPFLFSNYKEHPKISLGDMSDYLAEYMTSEGFDLPKLLYDDYFNAISQLLRAGQYVSCTKLLVSFIDTLAYLEYGDVNGNFVAWLTEYADLSPMNITPSQLWELRNSILHASNFDSRKVVAGKEQRIGFFVAPKGIVLKNSVNLKYFNLLDLLDSLQSAISNWIKSINRENDKFPVFIERYDRIVSDARYKRIVMENG